MKASAGKWLLHCAFYGYDESPVNSEAEKPTEHSSEDKTRAAFAQLKASYAEMGYRPWFAYIYDDLGNQTNLLVRPIVT